MLTVILSFLTGPNGIYALLVAAIGIALAWARKSGKDAARAETSKRENDSYAKHLKELEDAAAARAGVKPGKLPVDDPYRRD